MVLTCAPHPSYPSHCRRRDGINDSLGDNTKTNYLDSQVNGMRVVSENLTITIHQRVTLSSERKLRREGEVPFITCHKHNYLADTVTRDRSSLSVGALRNPGTTGEYLLTDS